MKRFILFISIIVFLGFSGLASGLAQSQEFQSQQPPAAKDEKLSPEPGPFGRALVIYYSATGKTGKVAAEIQAQVKGDLFKIEAVEELPKEEKAIIDLVKPYWENDTVMPIKSQTPDFSGYDVVFVGGPVWFGEPSFPLATFIKDADFKGHKVIPFGTSGSNYGRALEILNKSFKNAVVVPGAKIFDRLTLESEDLNVLIEKWLSTLTVGP
ncbi:MAG: hypothetical protein LBI10_09650 [Deltaproteobacteria bacterium]|nr:hypothetical protein [Deltaproteobacteria bacterium]